MSSSMDLQIIAERVSEVVNRRLSEIHKRIGSLESRVAKLELDINTLRSQTIESIVRSALTIKLEDLASAIAVKVSSGFTDAARDVARVAEELGGTVESVRSAVSMLNEQLPKKVEEAVSSLQAQSDFSELEDAVKKAVLKGFGSVASRVSALEKQVGELAESLGRLNETLTSLTTAIARLDDLKRTVDEMKESVDYSREVLSIIEERLKSSSSAEEGGEEG